MELSPSSHIEGITSHEVNLEETDPKELRAYSTELAKFCAEKKGVGLSACQIGDFRKLFVFTPDNKGFQLVINPTYFPDGSRVQGYEGCLSYPNETYIVKRYKSIKAHYWTVDENDNYIFVEGKMKGEPALIFQHETDHGNGITIAMKGRKV